MERLKIVNEQNLNYIKIYSCDVEQVEKGRVYGPTVRNHHLIHYVISGKGKVNVYGNLCECSSGTLIWIPPYTPFSYIADEKEPWYYAWIGIAGGECNLLHKEQNFVITNPTKQFSPGFLDSYFKDMAKHFVLDDATSRVKTLSTFYKMLSVLPRQNAKEHSSEYTRDASNGCLVLGQYMTGDVVMDNVNILFGDNDDRWITTNSDGVHIQANTGKLIMKNCLFEGLSDDCINIYQRATVIPEMTSKQTFVLDGTATGTRVVQNVGETLIFYNPNTGETLGEAKVTNIENISGSSTVYKCKVTIDKPIEGIIIGSELANATNVYIKEKGHNGSTITNCTFRYIRAGGVCLRANDVTVEGNTFEHISNRAVHVAVWSSEGSAVDGVKIINNTVTDCAYHNDYTNTYMAGAINIFMLNYARTAQVPNAIHQNVIVKGNTINGWHGRAMWIANSENVEIADNVFNGDDKLGIYRSFRYRYWKAMQRLMLDSFARQVYEWCDSHDVKLTGHYIEESTLGYQLTACGGVMPFYEYEHIPGIDWLGKWSECGLSAKQVGSVAAQFGKRQVLTESFGCCGWDVKPSELRHILGIQYANGVNMLCQHLIPYSERGTRKYDHPAHYSEVNPWVQEDFGTFNEYFTTLGHLLGEGEQSVNVAVLHPIRSVYFDYKRELERTGYGVAEFDKQFREDIDMLAFHGIEYHFIDETLFEKYGFVKNGQIGCGKCVYDYLVLPHMLTMDISTEKLLSQYVKQGGKILLLGDKPSYLEAECYAYDYLESNVTLEEIMQVQKYQVRDYNARIYSTYRSFDGKEYLYAINSSRTKTYQQCYLFAGKQFEVTLKPGEDILLCLSEEPLSKTTPLKPFVLRFTNARVSVKENYLPVDMVRYSADGKTFSEPWPVMALFEKLIRDDYQGNIFLQYEFEVEKVPDEIYLRTEKGNDIAAWVNGVELTEKVETGEQGVVYYDIASLVQKGRNIYVAEVNWYENEMVKYVLFGENVSESLRNCMVYDTELQPIELVGQFGVYSRKEYQPDVDTQYVNGEDFYISTLPDVVESEPITEGFPFLAGELVLRQKVVFDTPDICLEVVGEYQTATVKVNRKEAGKLLFDKELDISNFAKVGENEIEIRFLLSNKNLLGPHHLVGAKERYTDPNCFQLFGSWNGKESARYHSYYDIKRFYT